MSTSSTNNTVAKMREELHNLHAEIAELRKELGKRNDDPVVMHTDDVEHQTEMERLRANKKKIMDDTEDEAKAEAEHERIMEGHRKEYNKYVEKNAAAGGPVLGQRAAAAAAAGAAAAAAGGAAGGGRKVYKKSHKNKKKSKKKRFTKKKRSKKKKSKNKKSKNKRSKKMKN
jgi:hypothetical protein